MRFSTAMQEFGHVLSTVDGSEIVEADDPARNGGAYIAYWYKPDGPTIYDTQAIRDKGRLISACAARGLSLQHGWMPVDDTEAGERIARRKASEANT